MSKKNLNFLIFGSIPPPHGGITISILNLITALKSLNIDTELISKSNMFKFKKFDIAHIHYSKRWKVLLAILLGKALAKKTIVTKHGAGFYPQSIIWDKMILRLSDGMIVLNDEVYKRCVDKKNLIKLPPIFREGIQTNNGKVQTYVKKEPHIKYILLYAGGKVYIDNKEVYGVNFTLNIIDKLPKNIKLILVDPSNAYHEELKNYSSSKLIYFNTYIDFNLLVQDVDLYIRPTSSDGNSIATLEALSQGTAVLASDVVQRDENIHTYAYDDEKDFLLKINQLLYNKSHLERIRFKSIEEYLEFCKKIQKEKTL